MKAVLVLEPGIARCLDADRHLLRFERPLEVETVVLDAEAPFPATELTARTEGAAALAWWWNSARSEEFAEAIETTPALGTLFAGNAVRRHAVVTETHHRPEALPAAAPYFDRLYVSHLNSIPAGAEDRVGWLPSPAFGLTAGEAEALMVSPREPSVDLVFPFVPYLLGDRPQRLARISRITRDMGIDFRRGLYVSSLPADFVHARNYHNVLAAAKVALNLSVWRDLNQRLFEANLMGATVLSEWQPDHDRIEFDRANTFFFRPDLSDFPEALTAALAHQPASSPRLDVRNRHLTIHRVAAILSNLTGTKVAVAAHAGEFAVAERSGRRIEHLLGEGDREFDDAAIELLAMRCAIYNRIEVCIDLEAAYAHLKAAFGLTDRAFATEGIAEDILFLAMPLLGPGDLAGIAAGNRVPELRDMTRAAAARLGDPDALVPRLGAIIRECGTLAEFQATCRQALRAGDGAVG